MKWHLLRAHKRTRTGILWATLPGQTLGTVVYIHHLASFFPEPHEAAVIGPIVWMRTLTQRKVWGGSWHELEKSARHWVWPYKEKGGKDPFPGIQHRSRAFWKVLCPCTEDPVLHPCLLAWLLSCCCFYPRDLHTKIQLIFIQRNWM